MPFTFSVAEYVDMIYVYRLLEFTRHFPAFTLQPSLMLMKASMKKALFRRHRAVHVRVSEELHDVLVFPT